MQFMQFFHLLFFVLNSCNVFFDRVPAPHNTTNYNDDEKYDYNSSPHIYLNS